MTGGAVLAVLAALDLARPYAGEVLRPWQWAFGIAALVLLWRWLESRGQRFRDALPVLALAAFLLPST